MAFLRGMNLGRRRIKNTDLVSCFEALGFEDVSAFLASGNVIFRTTKRSTSAMERHIEKGLLAALDYDVPTFVRSAKELIQVAESVPFSDKELRAAGKLQVLFLKDEPGTAAKRKVLAIATEEDRLSLGSRELYWLPSAGVSDSSLDFKSLETALGPYTVRTARTIERLCTKLDV